MLGSFASATDERSLVETPVGSFLDLKRLEAEKVLLQDFTYKYPERVLRANKTASRSHIELRKAGPVDAFKQAWLDCLDSDMLATDHSKAWDKGSAWHGSIGESNLVLSFDIDGKVKGILTGQDTMTSSGNAQAVLAAATTLVPP
ncbi:hypothetical protein H1R20_g15664, partial [Candolleomyces eurysporus]